MPENQMISAAMTQDMPEPEKLIQLCQQYFPSLPYVIGMPEEGHLRLDVDNRDKLAFLVESLKSAHPEAGRHYWSIRAWGLMIWQPVMLAMAGVHLTGQFIKTSLLGQHVSSQMIAGVTFPKEAFQVLPPQGLDAVGRDLRECCDRYLLQLSDVVRVNPTMARLLLADRILATIITFRPVLQSQALGDVQQAGHAWLKACGLVGDSDFLPYQTPAGDETLALNRKGCCQHYRRCDGNFCISCPRQTKTEILRRLYEEWSPHAGVE